MNVILIGFRGSGKTTVGRALAERLKRDFIDCDEYIERRTHLSIAEIFSRHGESHFRTLESEALAELSALDGKVIATGGGAVLKYQNMQVFKRNGCRIFFLEVGPETALQRIQADPATRARRPALTEKDPAVEIREQIQLRTPYYLKAADVVVRAESRAVPDVVEEIVRDLEGRPPDERGEPAIIGQ